MIRDVGEHLRELAHQEGQLVEVVALVAHEEAAGTGPGKA